MDLRNQLLAAKVDGFVSISALRNIVTESAIQQHVENYCNSSQSDISVLGKTLLELFSTRARKLFALLVYCELDIRPFKDGLTDDSIFPIDENSSFPKDEQSDFDKLMRCQWELAPFWNTELHLTPPDDIPLDILFVKEPGATDVDPGSFGYITKVKIKEGHLVGYPDNQLFAMKTIDIFKSEGYDIEHIAMREVDTLIKRKHDYIVPSVLSFTKYWRSTPNATNSQKQIAIIFPWYPSSMKKVLEQQLPWFSTEDKDSRQGQLYEFVYQMLQGLAYLHIPHEDGCWTSHHDLKPANILVMEGRAVLGDLGKSRMLLEVEGSTATSARSLGTTEYCPPENFNADGSRSRKGHGRAFDMWSMGCIMVEVAILICFGWKDVKTSIQQFRKDRQALERHRRPFPDHITSSKDSEGRAFYNSIPVVDDWLKKLQDRPIEDHTEAHKLAKYLRLAVGMLRSEPDARIYSWEAVLDCYDLMHPNALDSDRLQKTKELIRAPKKSGLTDTPLHRAAQNGNLCRVMCLAGPNGAGWPVDAKNSEGKTPAEMAGREGHVNIQHYLLHVARMSKQPPISMPLAFFVHEPEFEGKGLRPILRIGSDQPKAETLPPVHGSQFKNTCRVPFEAHFDLEAFASKTEGMFLCYYGVGYDDRSNWLSDAIPILATELERKGHHTIHLDLTNVDRQCQAPGRAIVTNFAYALLSFFPRAEMTRIMSIEDLGRLLEQLGRPEKRIAIILSFQLVKNDSGYSDDIRLFDFLKFLHMNSAKETGTFKTFITLYKPCEDAEGLLEALLEEDQRRGVGDWNQGPMVPFPWRSR